jgi:NAD(P)H-hydrate repair Nnr-like enzyme with NAD(P)H-hydrate dehydratase domain
MVGAPLLSARGALYLGAGKVHVVSLADDAPRVDPAQPELMLHTWGALDLGAMQALAVGPGMGIGQEAYAALDHLLDRMLSERIATVFDADALNLFAKAPALLTRLTRLAASGAPMVLTPHPLEAAGRRVEGFGHRHRGAWRTARHQHHRQRRAGLWRHR